MIHLELPVDFRFDGRDAAALVNERLRRIASLVGGSGGTIAAASSSGSDVLLLVVAGTLSIRSNAAPLVRMPTARTVTGLVALVKQAPAGGDLALRLYADGGEVSSITVAAGATSAEGAANANIGDGALITLDITAVGYTFPGADLTLAVTLG